MIIYNILFYFILKVPHIMQNLALCGILAWHLLQNIGQSSIFSVELDLFPSPLISLLIFASTGPSSFTKSFTVLLGLTNLQYLLAC